MEEQQEIIIEVVAEEDIIMMEEQQDNNEEPAERLRIEDGSPEDVATRFTQMSEGNRAVEIARLEEHSLYQQEIHKQVFRDAQQLQEAQEKERQAFLQTLDGVLVDVTTSEGFVIPNISAKKLAQSCEMVVGSASSWLQFSSDEKMHISLDEFPSSSVQEFLEVILESKAVDLISCDAVVDCCRIARYLLCEDVLEKTTKILIASIDTANCLSFCQLADELNLPELFERSLEHMIRKVKDLENNNDVMKHLTPELRGRIAAIKAAMQSSVHNTKGSHLFFSSLDEYIAIFAEQVQYYRERLEESRERNHFGFGDFGSFLDAQLKIEQQGRRVRTLEIALAEQKKLFNRNARDMY